MADGQNANGDSSGYVHDPDAFRESDDRTESGNADDDAGGVNDTGSAIGDRTGGIPRNDPLLVDDADLTVPGREEFGRRGWVLVAVLMVSFLVIPGIIILAPPSALPFEVAFLILPLLPAFLLGAVAVWSALAGS
jgi:hypothetical protein